MLDVLPKELLVLIASQCPPHSTAPAKHWHMTGHRMLGVSRASRDAVLSRLTEAKLDLEEEEDNLQPLARLLHRICCQAPPGLQLELYLAKQHEALPILLQPGLSCEGGWPNVTALRVHSQSTCSFDLIPQAFPSLTKLTLYLRDASLGKEVLALLKQCSGLSSLHLTDYWIDKAVLLPTDVAAALAQLPALKELTLRPRDDIDDVSARAIIAAALSGLTALQVNIICEPPLQAGIITAAARNPNLQKFSLLTGDHGTPTAAQLAQLLTACTSLTSLSLMDTDIDDQGLEVLLTHGSNITSLDLCSIEPQASFADRACRWETLEVCSADVLELARLPLRTVTQLTVWAHSSGSNSPLPLQLPLGVPDAQLPDVLREAATNLASCPAWQAGFRGGVSLSRYSGTALAVGEEQQRIQLFEALAPLGGPAVKQVELSIKGAAFQWGRPEVQALARSLGGQVTTLQLGHCTLRSSFWVALDECFPALNSLHLQQDVTCSATDVAIFCGTRAAGRPFTLRLKADVYGTVQGQQLQASLAARGMAHVSVVRVA